MIAVSREMCYGKSINGEKESLFFSQESQKRNLPTNAYAVELTRFGSGRKREFAQD